MPQGQKLFYVLKMESAPHETNPVLAYDIDFAATNYMLKYTIKELVLHGKKN